MVEKFDGLKVFSATKAQEREVLGEKITEWIRNNPDAVITDKVITQSSDNEFHCLTITLFYSGVAKWNHPSNFQPRDPNGNGYQGHRSRG